jgi:DNA-binding transcriptional regulator YhcF (GntR family)
MSFQAIKWAFAQDIPGSEKLILLALANRVDGDGDCWPSMSTIAKDAGVSRATVMRVVTKLEDQGLVSLERRTSSHGKSSHVYTLNMTMKKQKTACSKLQHLDVSDCNIESDIY